MYVEKATKLHLQAESMLMKQVDRPIASQRSRISNLPAAPIFSVNNSPFLSMHSVVAYRMFFLGCFKRNAMFGPTSRVLVSGSAGCIRKEGFNVVHNFTVVHSWGLQKPTVLRGPFRWI